MNEKWIYSYSRLPCNGLRTEPMELDLSVRYPNPYCHVELTSGQMTASNRPRQTVSPVVLTHSTFHLDLSA
ncbi:hypothetical protein TNCV_3678101 [Trichonephila clavipes]|nr:hypothetical protein TNCV_3678101 [Trichonephila clavipes]